MNGENNNTSIAGELVGVERDRLQAQCLRLAAVVQRLAFNPLGLCYGCHESGVATLKGVKLEAHAPGCRVAAALAMRAE